MTEQDKKAIGALNTISYGLYVISSRMDGRVNAQCGNSLFQVTSSPRRVAIGINKQNYTFEFIKSSGLMAVSVLRQDQIPHVRRFGLQSGRKVDKFAGVEYITRQLGCPILPDALAYFECRVIQENEPQRRKESGIQNPKSRDKGEGMIDCATHMIFVCDVIEGDVLNPGEALTYEFYRRNRQ